MDALSIRKTTTIRVRFRLAKTEVTNMHSLGLESMERRVLMAATDFPITAGGAEFDAGQHIAVDADGNSYVTGLFSGTVDFKPGSGVVSLTSNGTSDIYIAKYSPRGKLVWVKQLGSDVDDKLSIDLATDPRRAGGFVNGVGTAPNDAGEYVNGVAVDGAGNVYLAGAFQQTMDFDPGAGTKNVESFGDKGNFDIFVIKLDTNGTFVYGDRMGGLFDDVAKDIKVTSAGVAYVSGYFTREADFDPTSKLQNVVASGRNDGFIMQLNTGGGLNWVSAFGGDETGESRRDSGDGLAIDIYGNVFVTGSFASDSDFNPTRSVTKLKADGETDAFIAYYGHSGKLAWVKQFGGSEFDGGLRVATDADRNVYAVSYVQDEFSLATLGSNQTITVAGEDPGDDPRFTDLLLTKLDATGNFIYARQLSGPGFEVAGDLIATGNQLVLSGAFYDTMNIGGSKAKLFSTKGSENFDDGNDTDRDFSYDVFAVNYTLAGTPINATTFGSTSDDFGDSIAADAHNSSLVLAGRFKGTVDFNPSPAFSLNIRSAGLEDIFITRFDDLLRYIGRTGVAI
jgi:hypothetical protein